MTLLTRKLALAVALASTTALGLTAAAAPASAKEKEQPAAKKDFSKAFIAAYQPFAAKFNAQGADAAALKAELPAVQAAASTADDKFATGQITYSLGVKAQDTALERQGVKMMIDSGRVPAADVGKYNFLAGQLAYNDKDYAGSRDYITAAINAGYAENDPQTLLAETYFAQNQAAGGISVLDKAIAAKVAAGQTVPEAWIKRGLAMAYQAKLAPESAKYAGMLAQYYPSKDTWGDAIAVQRNLNDYDGQDLLDLMRLASATGSLRSQRDYVDYINSADARRLPGEVNRIVDAGIAAGMLKANDPFVGEVRGVVTSRLAADKSDLPGLERDASASSANATTVAAAGDAFLSYNDYAKADKYYTAALAKPGADTARILTRLGIAQLGEGKTAEAQATFAKVEGARQAIARLWGIYAGQKTQ
ncbi:MAG: hypothetical protein ACTHK5_13040 [Tsuneonella sp.]